MNIDEQLKAAANKLAKWRSVFAGWQLGTRPKEDPECQAVRDHREVTMMLRAEVNALTALLVEHKVCTQEQLQAAFLNEIEYLDRCYQKKFPGFKSTADGMDINIAIAADTMRGWKP